MTSGSGNITINPVDPSKTVVFSVSKGSAGYVAARGQGTVSFNLYWGSSHEAYFSEYRTQSSTFTLSGGSTDLTTKQYSAKLVNSTTINCDGPVEWQVIEYA